MSVKLVGTDNQTNNGGEGGGFFVCHKFTASATGTAKFIRLYGTANGNAKVAIFADNAGEPGALLHANNTGQAVTANQWNLLTIPDTAITSGTVYWIANCHDNNSTVQQNTDTTPRRYKAVTYSTFTFPDPAGSGFSSDTTGGSKAGYGDTGSTFTSSLTGTLTTAGDLPKQSNKALAGTLSTAGALTRQIAKALAGVLSFIGTLTQYVGVRLGVYDAELRQIALFDDTLVPVGWYDDDLIHVGSSGTIFTQALDATLTTAASLARQTNKALAGTLTTAGALTKQLARTLTGTLSTAGNLLKQAQKALSGTLTTAGGLTAVRVFLKALTATLSTAGALTKQTNKALAGTLTTAGALTKQLARTLTGTLTTAGALLKQTQKVLAGTLTTSGTLTTIKVFLRTLTGTLSTAGALTKQTGKALAGTLTTAGALTKQLARTLTGTLSTAGNLLKQARKALSGAIGRLVLRPDLPQGSGGQPGDGGGPHEAVPEGTRRLSLHGRRADALHPQRPARHAGAERDRRQADQKGTGRHALVPRHARRLLRDPDPGAGANHRHVARERDGAIQADQCHGRHASAEQHGHHAEEGCVTREKGASWRDRGGRV
jgi:hypothetical protein